MALQNKGRAWTRYDFETLAGLPTTVVAGGTSRVTTLPAPTMASSPMLTPGRTTAPPPIHTANPHGHTAFVALKPQRRVARVVGRVDLNQWTDLAIVTEFDGSHVPARPPAVLPLFSVIL